MKNSMIELHLDAKLVLAQCVDVCCRFDFCYKSLIVLLKMHLSIFYRKCCKNVKNDEFKLNKTKSLNRPQFCLHYYSVNNSL